MSRLVPLLGVLALAPGAAAGQALPTNLEAVEIARSTACVDVVARVDALDARLAPLADRSQRLLAIAEAIAIEERAVIDSLDSSDPVESEIRAWFLVDAELAERYVAGPDSATLAERTAAREAIKARVSEALEAVQAEADTMIAATGSLGAESGRCNGAVFIQSAVLEACDAAASALCDAVRDSTGLRGRFRFVESAEVLWGLQELRAWTAPGPFRVTQTGQLGGARTVGFTRTGNVTITASFGPILRERSALEGAAAERVRTLTDSLGFAQPHPELVFLPSLAIQATLPQALDEEAQYVVHFGEPEEADILWSARASTGTPVEGVVELGPRHLARLEAGEPLTLTALTADDGAGGRAVYSIELTSLNQAAATRALVGYMRQGIGADLARLFPPDAGA